MAAIPTLGPTLTPITPADMPKRGPRLLPAEIEAIKAWIEAGAPNN